MNNSVMLIGIITAIANGIVTLRVNDTFNIDCYIAKVSNRLAKAKEGNRIAVEGNLIPKDGTFAVCVNDIFVIDHNNQ